ncbi:hypothetical protein ACU8KH_00061 [Lachancea thermotolerans]
MGLAASAAPEASSHYPGTMHVIRAILLDPQSPPRCARNQETARAIKPKETFSITRDMLRRGGRNWPSMRRLFVSQRKHY